MSEAKQLYKELVTKRASAKGQITKFKNYLNNIALQDELSKIQLTELNLKLAKFEALSVRVDDLQTEIEVLNPTNIEAEIDERDTIDQEIILNIATAKDLIEKYSRKSECDRRHSVHNTSCCLDESHQQNGLGLRLPQIQIAKFGGEYFRWLEFRDTYENLIHKNERISDISKFHYLVSYLQGDASRIISNLEISSKNYSEAWKLLCCRFENKRLLINHHLNSLFNIKQLPRESERSLRFLVDHVTKNLRALASLDQPTDKWDVLVIFMLTSKLDSHTLLKWEEYRNNLPDDVPTLEQFFKFLAERANVLESLNQNNRSDYGASRSVLPIPTVRPVSNSNNHPRQVQKNNIKAFVSMSNNNTKPKAFSCIICNERHRIYDCPAFKAKSVEERLADVTKYKLCENCLRQGHAIVDCRMRPCPERGCSQMHNGMLHRPSSSSSHLAAVDDENEVIVNYAKQNTNQVLLSTAIIEVSNPIDQQKVKVRALLDCGSQSSFISESLKTQLSLKSCPVDTLKVTGIGNASTHQIVESCDVKMQSINSNFNATFSCFVLKELTGRLPKTPVDFSSLNLPENIQLADPLFYKPARIDLLIGADLFWDILGNEQHSLGVQSPNLRSSKLGWIISGPVPSVTSPKAVACNHALVSKSEDENIEKMINKSWELEDVSTNQTLSESQNECERHFLAHTTRDKTGRFCVKLPFKESTECLGDTYKLAKRRFINLEKRFKRDPNLKIEYTDFIHEYLELGHLSKSNHNFYPNSSPSPYYYLCHHAVIKQESESTKLRVVFDGSAPSTSGYSLNSILMVGPHIQDSIFSILIRARQYKYILTGDIEKMYRQVLVHNADRDLQLIVWREDESKPIQTFSLHTVTYGTASASYLSTRCLWELGQEHTDEDIKNVIQKDFYVDDLITGSDDPERLIYIQKCVSSALSAGCFKLRKYKSNCPEIFNSIDMNNEDNLTISDSSSTLGLGWTPSSDTLHFPIKGFTHDSNKTITKRFIMSNAFKIFDPLGILSPIVVQPKMMIQKLWQQRLGWDEPVPIDIINDWIKFSDSVKALSELKIPRLVLGDSPKYIELHSFSDASKSALGACIYMKTASSNGDVTVGLLCAKSKVAPLKPTTIPRLELCAAGIAAKLTKSVLDSLRYRPAKIFHWCDSSVVLAWIKSDVVKLKIYVANRIKEIKGLTSASAWRYVPTHCNPADLISRGVDAKRMASLNLWWSGPDFLVKGESEWPVLNAAPPEVLPELKVHTAIVSQPIIDFNNYSSLNKLQRSFTYVRRFIFNLRHKHNKRIGTLSPDELRESLHSLCIIAQGQSFPVEYESLLKDNQLNSKSKLLALSPFLDSDKLIRVGGRINASTSPYDRRHPILLHASHRLTKLYFEKVHKEIMHAGPQLVLATVRDTVWPVNGRHLARRVVNNCVLCRRLRGKTLQPKMGDLPSQRLTPDFPFLSVGLDHGGPFYILNRRGRGSRLVKCYLLLIVCMRYKCLHLEAVSDLTKDAFLMTLRRFIARRGKPIEIFCDNGGAFVSASKEIATFLNQNQEPLSEFASQQGIKFSFIPAYSPHFGGLWEAGIKSAKFLIQRAVGNSHLTYEEISTLFAQVESILNSRPLCELSSSPQDLLPLTPGTFIIGRALTALPAPDYKNCKEGQLKRYQRLEMIRQHFWKRWSKEYVSELQQRTKWRTNREKLSIGDMVLLSEENAPPLVWKLGRVQRLISGPDGVSRVADVLTTKGCVRRSLVRLCKLPTAEDLQC